MMTDRSRQTALAALDADEALPLYASFDGVSRDFLEGYRRLVEEGMMPVTVASAMLGATVNLYDMFGMRSDLPAMLRAMADRLEYGGQLS